ncbi:MAG: hypothetical protein PHV93_02320 [Candidatus Pacebacteria bacterium]|nr:hypothetical protein [Candidatus Paceibacterota bacterium]
MKIFKKILFFLLLALFIHIVVVEVFSNFSLAIFPCEITPFVAPTSPYYGVSHSGMCNLGMWLGSSYVLTFQGQIMKIILVDVIPVIISAVLIFKSKKKSRQVEI